MLSKRALWGYTGFTIALCLLVFEAFLRLTGHVRGYNDPTLYRVSESGSRYELNPGWSGMYSGASVRINSLGVRGPEVPSDKAHQEFRILMVGDSVLFGQGVEETHLLSVQLERMLQSVRPERLIRVINAGVSGYNTSAELERLRGLLSLRPDLLIVAYTVDNDSDVDLGFQIDHTKTRVLDSAVNPSLLGRVSLWMHRRSSAYNFIRARIRIILHDQRRNPPLSPQQAFADDNPGWRRSRSALAEMHALALQAQIHFIVAGIGLVQLVGGLDTVAAFCREQGLPYVEIWRTTDLADYFSRYAISAVDGHANAAGLRVMAERLSTAIQPFIPD